MTVDKMRTKNPMPARTKKGSQIVIWGIVMTEGKPEAFFFLTSFVQHFELEEESYSLRNTQYTTVFAIELEEVFYSLRNTQYSTTVICKINVVKMYSLQSGARRRKSFLCLLLLRTQTIILRS